MDGRSAYRESILEIVSCGPATIDIRDIEFVLPDIYESGRGSRVDCDFSVSILHTNLRSQLVALTSTSIATPALIRILRTDFRITRWDPNI